MIINMEKKIAIVRESNCKTRDEIFTNAFIPRWSLLEHRLNQIIYLHENGTFEYIKNKFGPTGMFTPTQEQFDDIVEMLL